MTTMVGDFQRLRRLYAALSEVNRAIVRRHARAELLDAVCEILVVHGGFRMAWIGWHGPASGRIVPVSSHGDDQGYLRTVEVRSDDTPQGRGPSGQAFRSGRPYVCNDLFSDPSTLPWRAELERQRFGSSTALPIRLGGGTAATLSVYSEARDFFQAEEMSLLEEVAADVSFALDALEAEELRRQADAGRLAAEGTAARERHFAHTAIEAMPGIFYLFDQRGRFLRWNRTFEQVSGYSGEEIARMHPLDFFRGDERAVIERRIGEVFTRGAATIEAFFVTKGGAAIPYFLTGRRLELDGAAFLAGVGVDVTERRQAELALRELNERLEQKVAARTRELEVAKERAESADRLKSAFLATMSHELRTPLNSILGFTGILLQGLAGSLNPEQHKQLDMVQGSARHLLELINDVLDISKIEAGQMELRSAPFELEAAVARVAAFVRPLAAKKGLALDVATRRIVGTVASDRRRVEQILLNLLNNGVKFTDRGGVTLTVDRVDDFRAGPRGPIAAARLQVADTGIGIRPEDLARLFQPFRQLDSGLERQRDGTGLGLAISQRLAGLLGGTLAVESVPGQGSVFTLTLPLEATS